MALTVTPYVGVWIETRKVLWSYQLRMVTPYVGVWIETVDLSHSKEGQWSLLMWECGLKHTRSRQNNGCAGHSLCGSVD